MKINTKKKIKLYKNMLRIRKIEEKISSKYKEQEMRCPVHLSIGQEAIAVGVCENLKNTDKIVTAHRSHAHYLAKGGSLNGMLAELYGKETGCAKGLGGSMHLIDLKSGVYAAVPIVGSTIPIGVGIAWANKLKKKKRYCCSFFLVTEPQKKEFFLKVWILQLFIIYQFYLYVKIIIIQFILIFQKDSRTREIL